MDKIAVNGVTYWLPANNQEVIDLANDALANNEVICVRGSAHSFPVVGDLEKAIHTVDGKKYKYVMLSKMNAVNFDDRDKTVSVQAGCHLGLDPWDPTGISKVENSLLYQLNEKGYGFSDLGGIMHQTIGGFMSMGCSGGSTDYSFDMPLISIDIVQFGNNGAEVVTYAKPKKENPDDPFWGIVVSMGLLGIMVNVVFECEPNFYITGSEATTYEKDCQINLYDSGTDDRPSTEQFFKKTEFTRLMWWPQVNVKKMVVWQAKKATEQEAIAYAAEAYKKIGQTDHPPLKPYQEVPYILGSPTIATLGADLLYTAIGRWPQWLLDTLGDTPVYQAVKLLVESSFSPKILPLILEVFAAVNTKEPGKGPQEFADIGWQGLPMDNQMSDKLFPVKFTELWIPLDKSQAVMNALNDFYNVGPENTGAFSCEIYAAKNSKCWLSPAYGTDVIRIDVFWFGNNLGDPTAFYQKFWDLLIPFGFRPHWAKYMPAGNSIVGGNSTIEGKTKKKKLSKGSNLTFSNYLKNSYPKWEQWMKLRDQVDPDQVFVNDYWRDKMAIPHSK